MSTSWTQTTVEVIQGAMQLCQAVGVGETVSDEDSALCMNALDGILKELPIHGFSWPQISSAPVAVAWSIVTPETVSPPADYFGVPVLKFLDASGQHIPLLRIPKAEYELLDLTKTALFPLKFYVAPDLTFKLWPAPTANPNLTLTYQSIIPDLPSLTATPGIQQQYLNLLQYMLADEVSLKYGVPQTERAEIGARAAVKKQMMIQWAVDQAPICFEVVDGCSVYPRSPLSW